MAGTAESDGVSDKAGTGTGAPVMTTMTTRTGLALQVTVLALDLSSVSNFMTMRVAEDIESSGGTIAGMTR